MNVESSSSKSNNDQNQTKKVKKVVSFAEGTIEPRQDNIALSISKHTYIKDLGYTQYSIQFRYKENEWTVFKRYRDFEELHNSLVAENEDIGIDLPKLPKKRWFEKQRWLNKFDESYSSNRRCALQEYLRNLVRIPYLRRRSETLKSFISFEFIDDTAENDYYRHQQAHNEFYGGEGAAYDEGEEHRESDEAESRLTPTKLRSPPVTPTYHGHDRNANEVNLSQNNIPGEELYEIAGEEGAQYSITNYSKYSHVIRGSNGSPVPYAESSSSSGSNSGGKSDRAGEYDSSDPSCSSMPYSRSERSGSPSGSQSSEESEFDYNSRPVSSPKDYNSEDSDDEVEEEGGGGVETEETEVEEHGGGQRERPDDTVGISADSEGNQNDGDGDVKAEATESAPTIESSSSSDSDSSSDFSP